MKSSLISARQIIIAILFGVAAAAVVIFHIEAPIGMDLFLNPAEIFVSLGAAFGGPIAGLIIGFLYGIGCYATNGFASGVRNVLSHMIVAFVWGIWYIYLWRFTVNRNNGRWVRVALWIITMPIYYYVILLPLNLWIYTAISLDISFTQLYSNTAPLILPEIILTIIITGIVLAVLPDKYAAPSK